MRRALIKTIVTVLFASAIFRTASGAPLADSIQLESAQAKREGERLLVSSGTVEREWTWTGHGLVTTGLRDLRSGREWAMKSVTTCDWSLPGALDERTRGVWTGTESRISDDDGFISRHLEIISTIRYESARLEVQHVVWVFPGAPGLRTQLRIKALAGYEAKGKTAADGSYRDSGGTFLKPGARNEFLPLNFSVPNERLYWGYYNDPGNRHDQAQDMLKEQTVKGWPIFLREDIDWASAVAVKYGLSGVISVKESPKCVNQQAHNTGGFYLKPSGLSATGWGLNPDEIVADRFRECWANWTILYQDGDDGMQLALKEFDAARYPVFPERDLFLLSNTWGPANPDGSQFTNEDFVLKEISAIADLGLDVMQIDDGWQRGGRSNKANDFKPNYRNGWEDVKAASDKAGVRMGLWVAIRNASLPDLKQNIDELGFISWKADFDRLASRPDYEERIAQFREVMKHAWGKTQFTLCPEYDDPRYGWYFAREYGSIFFQNVQEGRPAHLTMVPFQVLRQHWLMAKYFPANKLQVMLQNPKRVASSSDAREHSHGYAFATGLPFVPCFFQSAQFLDELGRTELKALIKVYKTCREDIFTSFTFPIGELPDNESWSGFQMVSTRRNGGHLLVFRELHNASASQSIRLKFLAGRTLRLVNVLTGEERTVKVAADGFAMLEIPQPADFRLWRYEVN